MAWSKAHTDTRNLVRALVQRLSSHPWGSGGDALTGVLRACPNKHVCFGTTCILPDIADLAATAHAVNVSRID